ncbi:SDR family oxidoreductase [Palleronia sp.]|uniref:SDR family oxidoreductase n=1 Tax=Palleronia sp. TaxID=1940284 RepID=UPI0035C800AC
MAEIKKIAIFGAKGATGRQAVQQAVARGYRVRALELSWPENPDLPEGVEAVTANVLEDDLAPATEGCDAILSCIGLPFTARTALNPPPLYTESARRYVAAMKDTGIDRLVVISASFVETLDRGPLLFRVAARAALSPIFDQMGEMEQILRQSTVRWTAVRPGWLMEGELTQDYTITPNVIAPDLIRTRHSDLAHFMLDCLETEIYDRRTPAIARSEDRAAESARSLAAEIAH